MEEMNVVICTSNILYILNLIVDHPVIKVYKDSLENRIIINYIVLSKYHSKLPNLLN